MKRLIILSMLLTLWLPAAIAQEPHRCGADAYREWYAREYPELAERARQWQLEMDAWTPDAAQLRAQIVIPVVVHVVYQQEYQNISQEQIESQIAVLNDDYRAKNANIGIVPAFFQSLVADVGIEFCLATIDPEGAPSSGVTRAQTLQDDIGLSTDVHYALQGGTNAWDPERYLNIWVADMGENIVGRGSFPGTTPPSEDGVVIDPRYFGTTGLAAVSAPYHLGRTAVHEIGHYFNLSHPWGSGTPSCDGDDGVADTPVSSKNFLNECPNTPQASCGTLDMYTNYMYYTDDACLAQFTPGQKLRILAALNGPRAGLLGGDICQPMQPPLPGDSLAFSILPNPSAGSALLQCLGEEDET